MSFVSRIMNLPLQAAGMRQRGMQSKHFIRNEERGVSFMQVSRPVLTATLKRRAQSLLERAGIQINGTHPWDIVVHRDDFYGRVFREGSLGFGESYMDGWWAAPSLDQFF